VPPTTPPPSPGMYYPEPTLIFTEAERNLVAIVKAKALPGPPTITLQPAATATVLVTDPQNRPVKSFGVTIGYPKGERDWMRSRWIYPDDKGLITLTCLPAGVRLRLVPDGNLQRSIVNEALERPDFTLTAGEVRQLPPIIAKPRGRALNVFVGDENGKPIAGAEVYAGDAVVPVVADDQGKLALSDLPARGNVLLVAAHPTRDLCAIDYVDPDAGVWPGLILRPMGKATGVVTDKADGKPLAERQVACNISRSPSKGNWNWNLPRALLQRLGLDGPGPLVTTDAQGRWHLGNLVPGAEYSVVVLTKVTDTLRQGIGTGSFKAAGGADEQDVGTMECDLQLGR
jgi:hypothetical protein